MKTQSKLTNPEAYRFINMVMLPLVKKVCDELGVKYPKSSTSKKVNDFKDINITLNILGTSVQTSPTIYYSGNEYIGISLHKMMYGKNILTIIDNSIYIISIDKLRENWSNPDCVYIQKRQYVDGLGERAQMSRFKISYIRENADYRLDIDNLQDIEEYNNLLKNIREVN